MAESDQRAVRSIAAHGLIGDLRSAAPVATDGTIDWFCPIRFDAPSVFAAILDDERGGSWQIAPESGERPAAQFYFPDTNVLMTRFMTADGVVEFQDLMPVSEHQRIVAGSPVCAAARACAPSCGRVFQADQPDRRVVRQFPQGFTQFSLISAAYNLDRALEAGG